MGHLLLPRRARQSSAELITLLRAFILCLQSKSHLPALTAQALGNRINRKPRKCAQITADVIQEPVRSPPSRPANILVKNALRREGFLTRLFITRRKSALRKRRANKMIHFCRTTCPEALKIFSALAKLDAKRLLVQMCCHGCSGLRIQMWGDARHPAQPGCPVPPKL